MGERRSAADPTIDSSFLSQLRQHASAREIERGMACLRSRQRAIAQLDPARDEAARLLAQYAIWADIGFAGSPLRQLLQRFERLRPEDRSRLSIVGYLCLRMAEGMAAMVEEDMETALRHFNFVLSLEDELDDRFLLAIVYFWKGRCLRRRGEYDEALIFTGQGRDLASQMGHPRMAAVMQVLEGWLLFQQGKWKEAVRVSQKAESALRQTDDYVTLGNIQSFYGRMARREGRFDKAVEFFENAINLYGKRDPKHPNLARSLANMALAKRGIALQLQKRIDRDVEKRRKQSAAVSSANSKTTIGAKPRASANDSPIVHADSRSRLSELRREALDHLQAARAIYKERPNSHGLSTAHLNAGFIHLDSGDFQRAEEETAHAYEVAEQKQDSILMVRARILQCMIENAKVEEEVGGGSDPGRHARRAVEFIQEAVALAKHTQHHLLLANAYIWQGLTQCSSFFDNPDAAREAYDLARASCGAHPSDSIWQDLQTLSAKIVRKGSVHPSLKAWSQGAVGEKSFRQISEEFAEIVIGRVYERESHKVSRVASRLSISPKKVRRILARVGRRKPR